MKVNGFNWKKCDTMRRGNYNPGYCVQRAIINLYNEMKDDDAESLTMSDATGIIEFTPVVNHFNVEMAYGDCGLKRLSINSMNPPFDYETHKNEYPNHIAWFLLRNGGGHVVTVCRSHDVHDCWDSRRYLNNLTVRQIFVPTPSFLSCVAEMKEAALDNILDGLI